MNYGNVLIITYWSYSDALIQTYTLPYVRMIKENIGNHSVFLVTMDKPGASRNEKDRISKELMKEGIHWVSLSYSSFGLLAILKFCFFIPQLWWCIISQKVQTIHTWCTPAGGIGYILSILTGRRLILDSYEPHAEPMVEAGQWKRSSLAFQMLWWLEKRQSKSAYAVVACVEKMKDYAQEKYNTSFNRFYWKPAAVDFDSFNLAKRKNPELVKKYNLKNKKVFVYAGKFGGSYLTLEVFELFKAAEEFYGDRLRVLLLNDHPKEEILIWCKQSGFDIEKVIQIFVRHKLVPDFMGLGDVGLAPFVPVPSKRFGSPIKTGEYLAMGIPVIITKDISDDSELIDKYALGFVLQKLGKEQFRSAITATSKYSKIDSARIQQFALQYRNIERAKVTYKELYAD